MIDDDDHQNNYQIKEVPDDEYFFTEESSKIERGSSLTRHISSSFQGDSSLIYLANNLITGDAPGKNSANYDKSLGLGPLTNVKNEL